MATITVVPNVPPEDGEVQPIVAAIEAAEEDDTEAEEWRVAFLEMKQENARVLAELEQTRATAMANQESVISRLTEQNLSLSNQLSELTAKMMEQQTALTLIQSVKEPEKIEEVVTEGNAEVTPDKSVEQEAEKDVVKTLPRLRRY